MWRIRREANRSLAGLLDFSRDIDLTSLDVSEDATEEEIAEAEEQAIAEAVEQSSATERVETIFTLSFKRAEGNVAVRVDAEGNVITRNSSHYIQAAIQFLANSIQN